MGTASGLRARSNDESMKYEDYDPTSNFAELHGIVVAMVDAQGGQPIPAGLEWQNDRQTLAKKFAHHLQTIWTISQGSTMVVRGHESPFVDHGSIKVLARAVLENFIVFAKIFGDPEPETCRFRHMTWKFGGLKERQAINVSTPENRAKQTSEAIQLAGLLAEIKAHPLFSKLSKGDAGSIEKGNWKLGRSWQDLAVDAGLSERYFRNIYPYLCGYSHSGYAAAMQVGQASDLGAQAEQSTAMFGVMNLCMARFAELYARLFPLAAETLRDSPKAAYDLWNIDAARFQKLYESR